MKDLHLLPKVRDSWTYLYAEHCRIDQDAKAVALHDAEGKTALPCATLTLLMLGPGTSITHAAIRVLTESGCLVLWTGEEGVRTYAQGLGETRSSRNILWQAFLCTHADRRLAVVRALYTMRFDEPLDPAMSLEQVRGHEGVRVREAYARASQETGVAWHGRSYDRSAWRSADPVNRALSTANSCLYGICHAGIVSAGYSPALGFIHTGKMLSFVYDIADLYKVQTTIPIAFQTVSEGSSGLETRVRRACRDAFRREQLLHRIVPDIETALGVPDATDEAFDADAAHPGGLWDPLVSAVAGGINQTEV